MSDVIKEVILTHHKRITCMVRLYAALAVIGIVSLLAYHAFWYFLPKTTYSISLELPKAPTHPLTSYEQYIAPVLSETYKLQGDDLEFYTGAIAWAAWIEDVPPEKMIALIATESMFRSDAVSNAGAIGSTQVIPKWWPNIPHDVTHPEGNILAGAFILRSYKELCGGWECAFRSYNVGITAYNQNRFIGAQQ